MPNFLPAAQVEALDADVLGGEPVLNRVEVVGVTTSGGVGHFVGKSLAMIPGIFG